MTYGPQYVWVHVPKTSWHLCFPVWSGACAKGYLGLVVASMGGWMCQRHPGTHGHQCGLANVPKGTWDLWLPVWWVDVPKTSWWPWSPVWSGACAKDILVLMVTIMGRSIMPKTLSNIWSPVWSRACTNRTCMKHYLLLICCIKITVSWLE